MSNIISVIIPAYNRKKTILRAINSVLNQTYRDVECLVVDDGSEDDTGLLLKDINDERFRYIRYEHNKGACYARNVGIDSARGEYIAFQDSDDDWCLNKLEVQMSCLNRMDVDLVFCRLKSIIGQNVNYSPRSTVETGYIINSNDAMAAFGSSTQTFLGKSECIKAIRFDEELPRFQDWDFLIRFAEKYRVYYQRDVLATQYIGEDSITMNSKKGYEAMSRIIMKYKKIAQRKALSNLFMLKGTYAAQLGYQDASKLLKKALILHPLSKVVLAKYIMSKIGILSKWYRIKLLVHGKTDC